MIHFTSDLHLGHKRMLQYRPFDNIDDMNLHLLHNWNAQVQDGDEVYIMGDLSFMKTGPTLGLLQAMNGHKFLVRGNHDRQVPGPIKKCFGWVKEHRYNLVTDGLFIVLDHYPLLTWEKAHHGAWMIHGHSHGNLYDDPNARRIDVSVDAVAKRYTNGVYRPLSLDEVKGIMKGKSFKPVDHHGRNK